MTDTAPQPARCQLRLLAIVAAMLVGCIAWQLAGVDSQLLASSPPRMICLAAAVLLLFGLLILAASPTGWIDRIQQQYDSQIATLGKRQPASNQRWNWLAIAVCWISWLIAVPPGAVDQDLRTTDSAAFKRYAAEVREHGGPMVLLGQLYKGEYKQANQHPLMIGLLSLFDDEQISGQAVSIAITGLGFILLTVLVARLMGSTVAAVFAALLCTNATLAELSLQVTCECLLVPLVGVLWWHLQRLDNSPTRRTSTIVVAGVLLGLVYLTKGTGPVFLAGTTLWLLCWHCRMTCCATTPQLAADGPATSRPGWQLLLILLAAFVITASPLLVRNTRNHGSPLYNVNSYFMFRDDFENPVRLAERMSLGEAAGEFFADKSPAELIEREVSGLAWQSFNMARLLGPHPLGEGRAAIGLVLLGLAMLGLGLQTGSGRWLPFCWLLLLVPMFAWYSPIVQAGERFLAPVLPALACYAALSLTRLLSPVQPNGRPGGLLIPLACICWAVGWNALLWLT